MQIKGRLLPRGSKTVAHNQDRKHQASDLIVQKRRGKISVLMEVATLFLTMSIGLFSLPALSQETPFVPPRFQTIDENGINLLTGLPNRSVGGVSVGSESAALSRSVDFNPYNSQDNYYGRVCPSCVDSGAQDGYIFGPGFSLTLSAIDNGGFYNGVITDDTTLQAGFSTYWSQDGTQYIYRHVRSYFAPGSYNYNAGTLYKIVKPSGETTKIGIPMTEGSSPFSVSNNSGFILKFDYIPVDSHTSRVRITPGNLSDTYCDPASPTSCSGLDVSKAAYFQTNYVSTGVSYWQVLTETATDALTRTHTATLYKDVSPSGIQRLQQGPGGQESYRGGDGDTCPYYERYCTDSGSFTVATPAGTYSYAVAHWPVAYSWINPATGAIVNDTCPWGLTVTRADPAGGSKTFTSCYSANKGASLVSITDENGKVTQILSDSEKVLRVVYPEGNEVRFKYDDRANVIERKVFPKTGSPSPALISTASYDAVCSNRKTCNKPNYTIDANGGRTDYTYSSVHGGILTVTGPADASGIRPQTRYTYSPLYAQIKNSSGALVNAEGPIYKLTQQSTCASSTNSCSGTADERLTTYTYDLNNLLLASETVSAGDSSISSTTTYGYDGMGNKIFVDGPLAGDNDKSFYQYDAARQLTMEIGPDPDGAGVLKRAVTRHFYNADGNEIRMEFGVGSATDGSDFTLTSFTRKTYDSAGRIVKTEVVQP